jgi:hypothetical protein
MAHSAVERAVADIAVAEPAAAEELGNVRGRCGVLGKPVPVNGQLKAPTQRRGEPGGWDQGAGEEVARLKDQPGGDLAVGGAGLTSTFMKLGLIDEYRLFVSPVVLGAGTPHFPALDERINLELVETRTFASRVVYVRYQRSDQAAA